MHTHTHSHTRTRTRTRMGTEQHRGLLDRNRLFGADLQRLVDHDLAV